MPQRKILATALAAAFTLFTSGCAVNQSQSGEQSPTSQLPEQAVEPSPSDPFAAVDAAFERLAMDRSGDRAETIEDDRASMIWPRLVDRFRLASCPEGGAAARWANWYADNPEYMTRVLNRARPWLHHIVNEVEERDLPGELALLPIVESAFDPFAYSHGSASGPWQFLSGTARDFGVTINNWYDGRRDFVAATGAALDYLEYLGDLFDGDWALALAAYNAGQGRVGRAVRRNAARGLGTEWHELPLPRETLGYVPKMRGLGCLFRDPERYAFELPALEDRPQVTTVALQGATDVVALALRAGLDLTELVTLNAGLNRHMTPPLGASYLVVPLSAAQRVTEALLDLPEPAPLPSAQIRVKRGDSLSVLARRHGTTVAELKRVNNLEGSRLIAGKMLTVPGKAADVEPAGDVEYQRVYRELAALQQQLLPTDRVIHRVRPGDSLWVIARRYGISVVELQRMNGLGPRTLIRPGQRLVIETGRAVRSPAQSNERYVVRQGDSLWLISRRQRVGLNELMRWNGLDSESVLRPGQELIIQRGSDA